MKNIILFLFLIVSTQKCYNQTVIADSVSLLNISDTIVEVKLDTTFFEKYISLANHKSILFKDDYKRFKYDLEGINNDHQKQWLYIWIFIVLVFAALIRTLYWRDFQEYALQTIQVSFNQDRKKKLKDIFSVFSVILLVISIINCAIIAVFLSPNTTLQLHTSLILFAFLFTFFVLAKLLLTKSITLLIDEKDVGDFYISTFLNIVQTIGITLFPVIMLIAVSREFIFSYVVIYIAILFVLIFFIATLRWLSTLVLLMYKSLYHFLLYICVAEILVVFLFIKLLTKIAF